MRVPSFLLFFTFILIFSGCTGDVTANKTEILFEIQQGEAFNQVVSRLQKQKIIDKPTRFKVMARLSGQVSRIKFGVYQIEPSMPYGRLLDLITSGRTYSIRITIPEGYTMFQIAEILSNKGFCTKEAFIAECRKPERLSALGIKNAPSIEGYLYPDTYQVPQGYSAAQIADMLIAQFRKAVDERVFEQARARNISINELLTMASIVEREARLLHEKPIIAGVYYNRLNRRIPLQADPTLIYALLLDNRYDGDLKFSDFGYDSRYNTYKYAGLPPSPIANPGKDAILASLYPAKHNFIYFVARPDNSGAHVFTETLDEHNRAVQAYVQYDRKRNPRR